jgi:hypothetical protein
MPVDLDVVGRVGEHRRRLGAFEENVISARFQRRAAKETVIAKDPEIAWPRDGWPRGKLKLVCQVQFVRTVERLDAKVDFRELEADVLDLEIDGELGQLLEASSQRGVVPAGPVGELVVGEQIGLGLGPG